MENLKRKKIDMYKSFNLNVKFPLFQFMIIGDEGDKKSLNIDKLIEDDGECEYSSTEGYCNVYSKVN